MNTSKTRIVGWIAISALLVLAAVLWSGRSGDPVPSVARRDEPTDRAVGRAQVTVSKANEALPAVAASLGLSVEQLAEMAIQGAQTKYEEGMILLRNPADRTALREAFSAFQIAADAGHLDAILELARMYELGIGVRSDVTIAFGLYQKAAAAGNKVAQFKTAEMLEQGRGTEVDYELAAHWYAQAGGNGNPAGWIGLGGLAANGRGERQDHYKAFGLYQKAANAGDPNGLAAMGVATVHGWGVDPSVESGVSLLRTAAERGSAYAAATLSRLAATGLAGGQPDPAAALEWLRMAAEAGDLASQRMLGRMLASGEWGSQDNASAIKYLLAAGRNGDDQALVDLGKVAIRLNSGGSGFREALAFAMEAAQTGRSAGVLLLAQLAAVTPPPEATARMIEQLVVRTAESGDWRTAYIVHLTNGGTGFRDAVRKVSFAEQSEYISAKFADLPATSVGGSNPKVISMPAPVLPTGLNFKGTVDVSFVVGPNGEPTELRIRGAANPAVRDAVAASVFKWRFETAAGSETGKGSGTRFNVPLKF